MLVVSFELYDSGLNPHLKSLHIRNLEYNASRFYFCGLWLTIFAVGLLISVLAWYIGVVALLGWFLSMRFVLSLESSMEV